VADLYRNWAELAAAEAEGVDYRIRSAGPSGAAWVSIAIHGGAIEAGSGEMARAVAGTWMRYYELDGVKDAGNAALHITSTRYDEPGALAAVTTARHCLSFHGYRGSGAVPMTAIGGRDAGLVARVSGNLRAAGFAVSTAASDIAGTSPANICNKTLSGGGVQLEMSRALRRSFFPGGDLSAEMRETDARTEAFHRYAAAVRAACGGDALTSPGGRRTSTIRAVLPVESAARVPESPKWRPQVDRQTMR
jgi:phage replication-related protein YjqB (UPF0714/DUF867 family)